MCAIDKIPDRIRYYLLDWKDENIDEFLTMFPNRRLKDLDPDQIRELFNKVTEQDKEKIK